MEDEMDPKIMAKWINDTFDAHERSWDGDQYTANWFTAAYRANVPEPWAELVQAMCASGFADFPDWAVQNA